MLKYFLLVLELAIVYAADDYRPPEGGPHNPKNTQRGQYQVHIPTNSTGKARATEFSLLGSDMRLKNNDTENICIYAAASDKQIKSSVCDTHDSFVLKEIVPSGYPYPGWFQFTFKLNGYGTYCLQAGPNKGHSKASNGDFVMAAPCVGDEPIQIWKINAIVSGHFQYSDLGSGKCLALDNSIGNAVMWTCDYYISNQFWDIWP